MTTPNISEAARRAAEAVLGGALNYDTSLESVQNDELPAVAAIIQYVIDSAHPAPKEGATPETDAFVSDISQADGTFNAERVRDFARSLERRLSEKTREVEAHANTMREFYADMQNALGEHRVKAHCVAFDIRSLRAQLQKANELLGEASDSLYAAYSEIGLFLGSCSAKEIKDSFSGLDKTADRVERTRNRIATHLNQQSK